MRPDFPYTRLPGTRRGVLFSSSLWAGPDHLLLVRNTRFAETYKRFFYQDIQAVLVRKGPRFSVPAYWFIEFLFCVFAAIAEVAIPGWHRSWVGLPGMGLLAVWLLAESLFRSCTCYVKTAVSTEELPSLFRTRYAQRSLDLMAARIAEVQGTVIPEIAVAGVIPQAADVPAPWLAEQAIKLPSRLGLGLALASFLLLLVTAGFTYVSGNGAQTRPHQVEGAILIVLGTVFMVAALVSLWPATTVRGLRNLLVVSVVFTGIIYYATYTVGQFSPAMTTTHNVQVIRFFQNSQAGINAVNEIGSLILGAVGLASLWAAVRR